MHLLVTDRLACPRCGPEFGLILLADELKERRVLQGALGCANCRERYPVDDGFGDLRPSPRTPQPREGLELGDDPEGALRLAALLGVREGPGLLFLSGSRVRHASRLAAMIEGIEVAAMHPDLRWEPETEGVSRIAIGERFPFYGGSLRGVVLEGEEGGERFDEGVRVLAPAARLVFYQPPDGTKARMRNEGMDLLMEAESVLVGVRK